MEEILVGNVSQQSQFSKLYCIYQLEEPIQLLETAVEQQRRTVQMDKKNNFLSKKTPKKTLCWLRNLSHEYSIKIYIYTYRQTHTHM